MKNNNEVKKMDIPTRNIYVDGLIEETKKGNEEAKIELFNIVIKLFRTKTFNDRITYMKDMEQDLWFNFEKALEVYNHSSPFLSFIHNEFRDIYQSKLLMYEQVVHIPYYAQKKHSMSKAKSQEIEDDYDYANTSHNNEYEDKIKKEDIARKIKILLGKLKPLHQIIIKLEYGIIDVGKDNPTMDEISLWLYQNGHTEKQLTRERIRQIISKAMDDMRNN